MSTDWNIHCVDCNVTHAFNDANHMVDEMLVLIKHAPAIAALAPLMAQAPDVCLLLSQYGHYGAVDPAWFAAHAGHKLRPISEYGHLLEECRKDIYCVGCGSRTHRCGLDEGHEPPCVAAKPIR